MSSILADRSNRRRLRPHRIRHRLLRGLLGASTVTFVILLILASVGWVHEVHTGWVTESAEHGIHRRDAWAIDLSYCIAIARDVFEERDLSDEQTRVMRWDIEHHERNDETPSGLKRFAIECTHYLHSR